MRRTFGLLCVSVFCVVSVLSVFLNEVVTYHMTGYKRGVTCDDGGDGSKSGHFVQHVCLNAATVIKAPKACIDTSAMELLNCKWRLWKQLYTNSLWFSTYGKLPIVASILEHDDNGAITMARCKHNKTALPDIEYNAAAMTMLDEMLGKHGHIVTDVRGGYKQINESNVFLGDDGRICLVDFNLFPVALQPFMEKLHQRRLEPFKNIYGGGHIMSWITPPDEALNQQQQQQTAVVPSRVADIDRPADIDLPRRGLRATIQDNFVLKRLLATSSIK